MPSMDKFSGTSFFAQKIGTEARVALFERGVTVPISFFEYAQATILSIQFAVTIVSEFRRITFLLFEREKPVLTLFEKPLFVWL